MTLDTVIGLRAGEEITFASVAGMTDLNASIHTGERGSGNKQSSGVALATTQTYYAGGTWARVAPHNTTGMNKRIYRTLTTSSGTEYHYVVTIPAITSTYNDTDAPIPMWHWGKCCRPRHGICRLPT